MLFICSKGGKINSSARRSPQAVAISPTTKAARTIQKYWRCRFSKNTTAKIVNHALNEMHLTIDYVKSISFESLVVLLREKPIIAAMKAALQRMHLLSTFRHGSPSKSLAPENVNVRVFLAAFMIGYRPTHVFEGMGTLEQGLFEAAVPLLSQFERMCRTLLAAPYRHFQYVPSDQTKEFPTALFEYLKRFKAWKVPDEAKLSCRIKHALVALYQAEEHLPPDEPADSKLKVEFREQISRLRGKLQQISGQEALDKFDTERSAWEKPLPNTLIEAGGAYAALPGRMTNEQLAHELLIDPVFQLDEAGGCNNDNPVFQRIRDSFHKAFWESLIDDLKLATPCYVRVMRVLSEIRDGVKDLAGAREEGNIEEIVDIDFIKARAEAGNYSFNDAMNLIRAVVGVIQRVQAPRRDAETKEKWLAILAKVEVADSETTARVMCECLEFLLDRVNAMRIDAANARLRLIAPVIRDHGIDYERGKFTDKLRDGTLTLERTAEWFTHVINANDALARRAQTGCRVSAVKLHALMIVELVQTSMPPRADNVPETMAFDVARLASMRKRFAWILATESAIAAVSLTNNPELIVRVNELIALMDPNAPLDVPSLGLPPVTRAHVESVILPGSGVSGVLRKQLCSLLQRSISDAAPAQCKQRCLGLVTDVMRMAAINREVHAATYDKIVREHAFAEPSDLE
jgi:hypothetical protein